MGEGQPRRATIFMMGQPRVRGPACRLAVGAERRPRNAWTSQGRAKHYEEPQHNRPEEGGLERERYE
jgi:hypothetical protein